MTKKNYAFDVLINGSGVKEYTGPNGATYVEGKKSSEFTLRIQNNSSKRILAVVTIDGLSVIDGKPASFNSQGYIMEAWATLKIPGWRVNNKEVAKFYFDDSRESYAAKTGKGNNVGIIGCAIFEEDYYSQPFYNTFKELEKKMDEIVPWPTVFPKITWYNTPSITYTYANTMDAMNTMYLNANNTTLDSGVSQCMNSTVSSSGMDVTAPTNNIGTGFGRPTEHKVTEGTFARSGGPVAVMEIYYDDRDGLKAKGVYLGPTNQVSAFPEETGYCQPPKDWKK